MTKRKDQTREEYLAERREHERLRRLRDGDHMRELQRQSYQRHKEAAKARAKKWASQNVERRREIALAYAMRNIGKIKAYTKANPEKFRAGRRRNEAKRRAAFGSITRAQFKMIMSATNGRCSYCEREAGLVMDHFEPIANGGVTFPFNLLPACARCNSRKGARNPIDWILSEFDVRTCKRVHRIRQRITELTLHSESKA